MPKIVDHDSYREQLLENAFTLMAAEGYAVSMRQVARALGVSTGTLYHYFPSKQALFEQMVQFIAQREFETVAARLTPSMSLPERLDVFHDFLLEVRETETCALLLSVEYARVGDDAAAATFFNDFFGGFTQTLVDLLQLPEDVCRLLLAAVDGLLLHNWIDADRDRLSHQLTLLRRMVLAFAAADVPGGNAYA